MWPDGSRQFSDPITELPKIRAKPHDDHHLLWPAPDMNRLGLEGLRGLPCALARGVDSLVHSLVHQRYFGVCWTYRPAAAIDLRKRGNVCIDRHQRRSCACYNPRRLIAIDLLNLEPFRPAEWNRPPCTGHLLDEALLELMRDYYSPMAPLTDTIRELLAHRCDMQLCGCYKQRGNRRVHAPTVLRVNAA